MKKYLYQIDIGADDAPAKVLRAVGREKRVLEVGCASGVQTRVLKEDLGCAVTGIEIDPTAAADAAKYCERIIVGDLESIDLCSSLGDERFDVVTIADVLEHLRDPRSVLSTLTRFVSESGYVVASIPNVVHAGLILEMAHGRFDYRTYGLLDDTHLRFFTLKNVYRIFEECNLLVTHIDRVVLPVEESEFCGRPLTGAEEEVIKFIKTNNPEWQTYQFIVTAVPGGEGLSEGLFSQLSHDEEIKDLELANHALSRRVKVLESQLAWGESRLIYRFFSQLKRLTSWSGKLR